MYKFEIFGPKIKLTIYHSDAASPPQTFCHDRQKSGNEHMEKSSLNLKRSSIIARMKNLAPEMNDTK